MKSSETPEQPSKHCQDEIKCSICWKYLYRCISVKPCMHNFCGFCFSEYLSGNYWRLTCPACRGEIQSCSKNHLLNNLIASVRTPSLELQISEKEKAMRDERDAFLKGAKLKKFHDRSVYFGFLKDVKREGKGKFMNHLGDEYDGEWKDDKREGYGELNCSNGRKYKGQWKNDQEYGFGEAIWPNGAQYKGEWRDGKFNGFGEHTWTNGSRYKGDFKDGVMEGQGELTSPYGDFYKGRWKNGKRHGFGELTWADGWQDIGIWKDDWFCGLTQVRRKERRWKF